jgi:hypothetical protein
MSTVLWIVWVLMFGVLEWAGNERAGDGRYTLTNRVRAIMRTSDVARILVRSAIAIGLAWLAWHFLVVDPVLNPGAW